MNVKTILTDKDLSEFNFGSNFEVKKVNINTVALYADDPSVIAIAGSRAMAIKCADMNLPSLKLFQLTSAGFDGVPCKKYKEKNIAVANAGNVYSTPIAETVVFGILQMAKKIRKNPNNRLFRISRGYDKYITEIVGKKFLIMGAGNIGTAVADRLLGFGAEIDGYDPYCIDKPQYKNILRSKEALKSQLGKYDYIISTLPDNNETKNFLNKELFDCMKDTVVIVNVGRKTVFDNDAFYTALKTKKIGGAVLDMFEKVPNPLTNKYRRLKNVIVLPGVAAISKEVNPRLTNHMAKNILAVINEKPLENVINGVK